MSRTKFSLREERRHAHKYAFIFRFRVLNMGKSGEELSLSSDFFKIWISHITLDFYK